MSANNNQEIITKEEFIEKMERMEKNFLKLINIKESEIKDEIAHIKEKSTSILQKSEILINAHSSDKLRDEKISDLEAFKNKANDMMISHDIRINNNIRDIGNLSTRYNKIFTENFTVPGFIGPSCQYKTISEYLNFNIDEVSKLRIEKDEIKKEQKEYRSKMDNFMKQMLVLNESAIARSQEYTNGKQKDFEAMIVTKLEPLNDKVFRFYELSSKFQSNAEKEINKFREEIQRILKTKEELIEIINEKENKIKSDLDDLIKKVDMNIQDIETNKNKIAGLKDKINKINNSYNKLNVDLNVLKREINKNNNINNLNNSDSKDVRYSVADFSNSFGNNQNKIDAFQRRNYKNKTVAFLNDEKVTEKDEDEKDEKNMKNNDNKENKDKNEENKKINDNKNDAKNLDEIIINRLKKQKTELKNNLEKDKYKLKYNKMMKETPEDNITFETFYLGNTKIPIITKPFLLDQRILSDEEMNRYYMEKKKEKKKEKIRLEKIRNSFFKHNLNTIKNKININDISNNMKIKNFDINYYKKSIPKSTLNKNSEENVLSLTNYQNKKIKEINNGIKFNNLLLNEKGHYKINSNTNNMKSLNLINLRLDNSVAINPETNNGAYVLAQKQLENNKMTRINLTPTSYMHLNDYTNGKKTSKLVSMTFMKEEQKMMNSFNNTLENEDQRMKLEVGDLYKSVKFYTKS